MGDLVHFSVTIMGKDRPGIVADTAEVLYRLGCNIEDSSCTLLAGDFAIILVASHEPPFDLALLGDELRGLGQRSGLTSHVRLLAADETRRPEQEGELCVVSVHGADRPGIVYRVTRELARRGINITDLNTRLVGTAEQPAYVLMLEAVLPAGLAVEDVQALLAGIKSELAVEIGVRPIPPLAL